MNKTLVFGVIASLFMVAADGPPAANQTTRTESQIFVMDQVYKSMFGPNDTDQMTLLSTAVPEVLWVTAIEAKIVGGDGETPESPEYFCHSVFANLNSQPTYQRKVLKRRRPGLASKLFTLVQGVTEIRFPDGYGMPVLSNDQFASHVMVMNPTERDHPVEVGVDSEIEFVRSSDLRRKMKPLVLLPLVTKVPVEDEHVDHSAHQHGGDQTCLATDEDVAVSVDRAQETGSPVTVSKAGIKETGHWYVPPGRHVYRHRLERLGLGADTTAHHIYAHLHPFGESLELIDLTTGETVFKAEANNYSDHVAVERISQYSSQDGLLIHRDHDYEIVAVYNNTTNHDVDSMAVMYLYLLDPRFSG